MAKFRYKAFDDLGAVINDVIEEDDIDLAKDRLEDKDYQVIRIVHKRSLSDYSFAAKLNDELLASFCGEIGTILESGVSILKGLEILYEQAVNKNYKKVIGDVLINVKKGMNLSMAMERAEVFPELLTDMVHSGEISSHLVDILFSMEDFYTREANIKGKIKSASVYPVILLLVSVGMILFFNFFVFSELKTIFEDMTELPALTQGLISSMDFLNNNPLIVLGAVAGVVILITIILRLDPVRYIFDKYVLELPVIGQVRKNIIYARVASSMAIFIKSAVPLTKVLSVVEAIAANKYITSLLSVAKEEIIRGQNISDAFEDSKAFDTMMVQMIRIGEETGKLEDMLFKLAEVYEKKSNVGIERMVALIEPIFTLVVGILVGIVILAMAMPIFDMSNML